MNTTEIHATAAPSTWGLIESVALHSEGGLDGVVDVPAPGMLMLTPRLKIIGWCREVRSISATFGDTDVDIAGATVLDPRPDVAQALGRPELMQSGFELHVDLLQLPQRFTVRLVVERLDGSHAVFATLTGTQAALAPSAGSAIAPVLISAFGRSGTTWLMSLLRELPQVLVTGLFPYEERPLAYWLHTLKVLTSRADHLRSATPDDFPLRAGWTGSNPYHPESEFAGATLDSWLASGFRRDTIEYVAGAIRGYYEAQARDLRKPQARYFAEKVISFFDPVTAHRLFGECREIVLVRDPRDTLASVLAFNRQRGVTAFDVDRFHDEEGYVLNRGRVFELLLDRTVHGQALLLRYEDLVTDTGKALRAVVEYLGLDCSDAALAQAIERADVSDPEKIAHRTSKSLQRSIGRWRQELSPATAALFELHMRDALQRMGYDA